MNLQFNPDADAALTLSGHLYRQPDTNAPNPPDVVVVSAVPWHGELEAGYYVYRFKTSERAKFTLTAKTTTSSGDDGSKTLPFDTTGDHDLRQSMHFAVPLLNENPEPAPAGATAK